MGQRQSRPLPRPPLALTPTENPEVNRPAARPAHLKRVHTALVELPRAVRARLGVTGPNGHQLPPSPRPRPQGTYQGAVACNGNLCCPATPPALFDLGPAPPGASAAPRWRARSAAHSDRRRCASVWTAPRTSPHQPPRRAVAPSNPSPCRRSSTPRPDRNTTTPAVRIASPTRPQPPRSLRPGGTHRTSAANAPIRTTIREQMFDTGLEDPRLSVLNPIEGGGQ